MIFNKCISISKYKNLAIYDKCRYFFKAKNKSEILFYFVVVIIFLIITPFLMNYSFSYIIGETKDSYILKNDVSEQVLVSFVKYILNIIERLLIPVGGPVVLSYILSLTSLSEKVILFRRIKFYKVLSSEFKNNTVKKVIIILLYLPLILLSVIYTDKFIDLLRNIITLDYYRAISYKILFIYCYVLIFIIIFFFLKNILFLKENNFVSFILKGKIINRKGTLPHFIINDYRNIPKFITKVVANKEIFSGSFNSEMNIMMDKLLQVINNKSDFIGSLEYCEECANEIINSKISLENIACIFKDYFFCKKVYLDDNDQITNFINLLCVFFEVCLSKNKELDLQCFFECSDIQINNRWNQLVGSCILSFLCTQESIDDYYDNMIDLKHSLYIKNNKLSLYNAKYFDLAHYYKNSKSNQNSTFRDNNDVMLEEIKAWIMNR